MRNGSVAPKSRSASGLRRSRLGLDWHRHPGGQILLVLEGTGYYFYEGDVIKCLPGVEHWHGASPTSGFSYLATTPIQKGKTIWLEPVSDKDYNSAK